MKPRCLHSLFVLGLALTLSTLLGGLISGSARAETSPPADDAELARLERYLVGVWTSGEQAGRDADYLDVHQRIVRIWPERQGERWVYVEQAVATALDRPYRQRVYRLERRGAELASVIYTISGDPLRFAGAWKSERPLAGLEPKDLVERTGCALLLEIRDDGTFRGATRGRECPSERSGAAYATVEVVVTEHTLSSWDRGYDADGKQVWGAEKGPYQFRKLSSEPATSAKP